jgi:hypothetical protein
MNPTHLLAILHRSPIIPQLHNRVSQGEKLLHPPRQGGCRCGRILLLWRVHSNRYKEANIFRPEDIREFLQHKPFQPFRLTLTDGRTYDVRHPEMAMVGRSAVAIGLPAKNDPRPVFDRLVTVSLLHIMQVEPSEMQGTP